MPPTDLPASPGPSYAPCPWIEDVQNTIEVTCFGKFLPRAASVKRQCAEPPNCNEMPRNAVFCGCRATALQSGNLSRYNADIQENAMGEAFPDTSASEKPSESRLN